MKTFLALLALAFSLTSLPATHARADGGQSQLIVCGDGKVVINMSSSKLDNCPLAVSAPEGSTEGGTLKWVYSLSASNHKNGKTQCVFVHTEPEDEDSKSTAYRMTCELN